MTAPVPIYSAITLTRMAISAAVDGIFWQRNDSDAPMPFLIFDSQDKGGLQTYAVGALGWRGLITIRAIAAYQDDADAALSPVYAAMQSLTTEAGYTIAAVFVQPIVIPPTVDARYAAAQWELFIERTP